MASLATDSKTLSEASRSREAGLVLRPVRANAETPLIPLEQGRYVIGSAPDADLHLDNPGVDPQHAVLLIGPQRSVLKAFSRFTWLNDGIVRESVIKPGDRLYFGPVEFEVVKAKRKRPAGSPSHEDKPTTQAPVQSVAPAVQTLLSSGPSAHAHSQGDRALARRESLVGELHSELLLQLDDLIQREILATDLQRRLVEQGAQVEARRRILEERQVALETSRKQLGQAESEFQTRSEELAEQTARFQSERAALTADSQKLAALKSEIEQKSAELEALQRDLEERRLQTELKESQLNDIAAGLDQRSSELALQEEQYRQSIDLLTQRGIEQQSQEQRLADHRDALEQLAQDLDEQRTQLEIQQNQFSVDQLAYQELFKELSKREQAVENRQIALTLQSSELERLKSEFETETTDRRLLLTGEIDRYSSERDAELTARAESLEALKLELDLKREEFTQWQFEKATLSETVASTEARLQEAEAAVQKLTHENSELKQGYSRIQETLESERSQWFAEKNELGRQSSEQARLATERLAQSDSLEGKISQLQALLDEELNQTQQHTLIYSETESRYLTRVEELEQQIASLQARIVSHQGEQAELTSQCQERTRECDSLRNELEQLKSSLETDRDQARQLEDDLRSREQAHADVTARLEEQIQSLQQQLDTEQNQTQSRTKELELELQTLQTSLQEERALAKILSEQCKENQTRHAEETAVQEEKIRELQSRLEQEQAALQALAAVPAAPTETVVTEESAPTTSTDIEVLKEELARLGTLLESEREQFQKERAYWENEQDMLLRDRQALEQKWQQLESRRFESAVDLPESEISRDRSHEFPTSNLAHGIDQTDADQMVVPESWWARSSDSVGQDVSENSPESLADQDLDPAEVDALRNELSSRLHHLMHQEEDSLQSDEETLELGSFHTELPLHSPDLVVDHDDSPTSQIGRLSDGFESGEPTESDATWNSLTKRSGYLSDYDADHGNVVPQDDHSLNASHPYHAGDESLTADEGESSYHRSGDDESFSDDDPPSSMHDRMEHYGLNDSESLSSDAASLRAQLAEMFGIRPGQTEGGLSSSYDDQNDYRSDDSELTDAHYETGRASSHQHFPTSEETFEEGEATRSWDLNGDQFEPEVDEQSGFESDSRNSFEETVSQSFQTEQEQSDEDIMTAYLARLLNKSPYDPVTQPTGTVASWEKETKTEADDQEETPPRVIRRLNAAEKENLRASLDSFRELANQQARAAVAKHKSNELKSGVQTMSVVAALMGVVSTVLLSAEMWSSQSYRGTGLFMLMITLGICGYTVFSGLRIRQLVSESSPPQEQTSSQPPEEDQVTPTA